MDSYFRLKPSILTGQILGFLTLFFTWLINISITDGVVQYTDENTQKIGNYNYKKIKVVGLLSLYT